MTDQLPVRKEVRAFWLNPEAFAFNLLAVFLDAYGTDGLSWTPETIEMEIHDDVGVDLPAGNFDKLMTAITLLTSNSFFVSLPDFLRTCVSLTHIVTPHDSLILPDSEDLAWGITEALLIEPADPKAEKPFSDEIVGYIGETLDSEGILTPPDVLRIATRDPKLMERINFDFSDDPAMFAAIQVAEQAKTDSISRTVSVRLRAVVEQLQALPLAHGKMAVVQKLLARMPATQAG